MKKNRAIKGKSSKEQVNKEQRKEGEKTLRVYMRRCNNNRLGNTQNGGLKLKEPGKKMKVYEPAEYIKKLKGVQISEQDSESESDAATSITRIGVWETGESSNWEANEERALIPINQEADSSSEWCSLRSEGSQLSRNSSEIWSAIKGTKLEEHARQWLLKNLLYMGERLGLRLDERKEETLRIAHEIEERSGVNNFEGKRTKGRSREAREINRSKCNVNYDRRGLRRTRKQGKTERKQKGITISCQ